MIISEEAAGGAGRPGAARPLCPHSEALAVGPGPGPGGPHTETSQLQTNERHLHPASRPPPPRPRCLDRIGAHAPNGFLTTWSPSTCLPVPLRAAAGLAAFLPLDWEAEPGERCSEPALRGQRSDPARPPWAAPH